MNKNNEKLQLLLIKLENLLLRQQDFEREIKALRQEVAQLQEPNSPQFALHQTETPPAKTIATQPAAQYKNTPIPDVSANFTSASKKQSSFSKSDFEKFIGENLISKIGILILILGIGVGAKLAIDKGIISPLTRIILGYLAGFSLLVFALKLKEKYKNFSAVLLSGAVAIVYFITYAAYTYYQLFPQSITFLLMVIFTLCTVLAALWYNRQITAQIGLVGAYAVPFLLSDGAGNIVLLFTYMALINIGILILAVKKYWKSLYYLSFGTTWFIFLAWQSFLNENNAFFKASLLFATVFFLTFHLMNLAYKALKKEQFTLNDVAVLLLNSFIFYGVGYAILQQEDHMMGVFTLANALFHLLVSLLIFKLRLADKNLFYFSLAMVITFITIAVPVELNGNWVTLFWVVEAAVLFYLGRSKKIPIYEKLALPMVFLSFFSLLQDWLPSTNSFDNQLTDQQTIPFLNVGFLSAGIYIIALLSLWITQRRTAALTEDQQWGWSSKVLSYTIPTLLIIVMYGTFWVEINHYFQQLYQESKITISERDNKFYDKYNVNYILLQKAFLYIYSLLFVTALTFYNLYKLKSTLFSQCLIWMHAVLSVAFLIDGLYGLSELRAVYLQPVNTYFEIGMLNIYIRYIAIAAFALLLFSGSALIKQEILKGKYNLAFDYFFYTALGWILSSELLHLLGFFGLQSGYKIGLSILWGSYALFLIGIGLWKNKKHLRIGAIALFGLTLIKLFIYDISSLDTIAKTIVFVCLGLLLLIISFLYNKYKHLINDDIKNAA